MNKWHWYQYFVKKNSREQCFPLLHVTLLHCSTERTCVLKAGGIQGRTELSGFTVQQKGNTEGKGKAEKQMYYDDEFKVCPKENACKYKAIAKY